MERPLATAENRREWMATAALPGGSRAAA